MSLLIEINDNNYFALFQMFQMVGVLVSLKVTKNFLHQPQTYAIPTSLHRVLQA